MYQMGSTIFTLHVQNYTVAYIKTQKNASKSNLNSALKFFVGLKRYKRRQGWISDLREGGKHSNAPHNRL